MKYNYLGSGDGMCDIEIRRCIGIAKMTFRKCSKYKKMEKYK